MTIILKYPLSISRDRVCKTKRRLVLKSDSLFFWVRVMQKNQLQVHIFEQEVDNIVFLNLWFKDEDEDDHDDNPGLGHHAENDDYFY